MNDMESRIRASFAAQSMMTTLGSRMLTVERGLCRIAAPVLETSRQQHGFGHAALTFAIGDSAAGYAALTLMDEGQEVLTAEMKINLLAPAQGERLVATGEVVKSGRRLIVVSARVIAEGDGKTRDIALLQGTMIPV